MAEDLLKIDGSMAAGGGQVLRASLALSMALGRPFSIFNIRAQRPKPGLKRQHLTCIQAAQQICQASVSGAAINSTAISFQPGVVRAGNYTFNIGSGGSCALVLQALVPPLLTASGPSRLTVIGGTHVPGAPPFEFLQQTWLPWLEKMGPRLSARMNRAGFMEVGGGDITVDITPAAKLKPVYQTRNSALLYSDAHILLNDLDASIGQRERAVLLDPKLAALKLRFGGNCLQAEYNLRAPAEGPGNAVLIRVHHEAGTAVCGAIGRRGLGAEKVARRAVNQALKFIAAEAAVDARLADQLLVPLALAGGGSFLSEKPTTHTQACLKLTSMFTALNAAISRRENNRKSFAITLSPKD